MHFKFIAVDETSSSMQLYSMNVHHQWIVIYFRWLLNWGPGTFPKSIRITWELFGLAPNIFRSELQFENSQTNINAIQQINVKYEETHRVDECVCVCASVKLFNLLIVNQFNSIMQIGLVCNLLLWTRATRFMTRFFFSSHQQLYFHSPNSYSSKG